MSLKLASKNLEFLKKTTNAELNEAMKMWSTTLTGKLVKKVEGDGSQPFVWLGRTPLLEKFTGEVKLHDIAEMSQTITNEDWWVGLDLLVGDLSKVNGGDLAERAKMLAIESVRHPLRRTFALINAGHTGTCYDGQFFFDTDHIDPQAEYQTNQSNDLTASAATPASPTLAELEVAVDAAISAQAGFFDDKGEYWFEDGTSESGLLLMVPYNMRSTALKLFNSQDIPGPAGGTVTNPNYKRVEVMASKRLEATATDVFYLFKTDEMVKPFALQYETIGGKEWRIENTKIDGDRAVLTDHIAYTIKGRQTQAYGQWRYAVRTDFN